MQIVNVANRPGETDDTVTFTIDVSAAVPIERIEIRNRMQVLETWLPYTEAQLGRRIRIIWEGSEYRGRGRQSVWDGSASLSDNAILSVTPINLWNIDKPIAQPSPQRLAWSALTTGGFGGADLLLADAHTGRLKIDTEIDCQTTITPGDSCRVSALVSRNEAANTGAEASISRW